MTEECFTQDGIDAEVRCTQHYFLDADQGDGHTLDTGRKPTLTVQPVEEEGSFTPECLGPLVGFMLTCLHKPKGAKALIWDESPLQTEHGLADSLRITAKVLLEQVETLTQNSWGAEPERILEVPQNLGQQGVKPEENAVTPAASMLAATGTLTQEPRIDG